MGLGSVSKPLIIIPGGKVGGSKGGGWGQKALQGGRCGAVLEEEGVIGGLVVGAGWGAGGGTKCAAGKSWWSKSGRRVRKRVCGEGFRLALGSVCKPLIPGG